MLDSGIRAAALTNEVATNIEKELIYAVKEHANDARGVLRIVVMLMIMQFNHVSKVEAKLIKKVTYH